MDQDRFSDDERGTSPDARQTSPAPHRTTPSAEPVRFAQVRGGKAVAKGVFFLLSKEGHQRYLMDSGVGGEPSAEDRATGAAVFENSVAFARKLNRGMRRSAKLTYDPLEICIFTSLEDLLKSKPSADVAGGKWASAAILTHSTHRAIQRGSALRPEQGLWVTPDGVFVSSLREFARIDDDPEFTGFRARFEPGGSLHLFVCGGSGDFTPLACAARAFFGISGSAFIPNASIQVRDGGILYAKVDESHYRPFDPATDLRTVTATDCLGR